MIALDSALAHMTPLDTVLAGFGLSFADLYDAHGLQRLDARFLSRLEAAQPALAARLDAAREAPDKLAAKEESALLLELAPHLEQFVADLFGIQDEVAALAGVHAAL